MRRSILGATIFGTEPPPGPPGSASTFNYEGDKIGVQWTNVDANAATQTGFTAGLEGAGGTPSSPHATTSPGQSQQLTNETNACVTWFVRHIKNDQVTAWVQATAGHNTAGCGLE